MTDFQAEFKQIGKSIDIALTADAPAGTVRAYGDGICVQEADGKDGETVAHAIEGVYEFAKTSGVALAQGALAGWNDTAKEMGQFLSSSDKYGGIVHSAAADSDSFVSIKINAPAPPSAS